MKTLTVEELEEELEGLNPRERLQYILELGRELEPLPEELKTEENRVQGCVARAWLKTELKPGVPPRLHFRANSEGQTSSGIIAILLTLLNDKTPEEILAIDVEEAFKRLELLQHLQSRSSGLKWMARRIRDAATHERGFGSSSQQL